MKNAKYVITVLITLILLIGAILLSLGYLKKQEQTERPLHEQIKSGLTYPLYFSIMIHMEEDFKDDRDTALFERHVEQLNWAMDLFEEYDAKITIETEKPFATAVLNNDVTILTDAIARGHGVGTHCGKDMDTSSVNALTESYKERKELVDSIVGAENNRGCSGGWGTADYVLAATAAGFGYLDGVVYLAYLSMPASERPEQLSDQEIKKVYYHDPAIPEFSEHIYPRFLENAEDFEEDAAGELVLLNGELGEISSLFEGRKTCGTACELTEDDFTFIYEKIETTNEIRDNSRVAHLYVHVPLNTFVTKNEALLRSWLSEMQNLQNKESIQWATQWEVYDAKLSERE